MCKRTELQWSDVSDTKLLKCAVDVAVKFGTAQARCACESKGWDSDNEFQELF